MSTREMARMRAAGRHAARMADQHWLARTATKVVVQTPKGSNYWSRRALAGVVAATMIWNNQKKWFEAPIGDASAIYKVLRQAWPNVHVSPGVKEILR